MNGRPHPYQATHYSRDSVNFLSVVQHKVQHRKKYKQLRFVTRLLFQHIQHNIIKLRRADLQLCAARSERFGEYAVAGYII